MSGYKKIKRSGSFYVKRQSPPRRNYSSLMGNPKYPVADPNSPKCFKLSVRYKGASYFSSSAGGILGQATFVNDPSICTEWSTLNTLFDMYKVLKCTMQVFPSYNDNYTAITTGAVPPLYFFYDPDTSSNVSSVDAIMGYSNMRVMQMQKGIKYTAKVITQTDNSVNNAGMATSYIPGWGTVLDSNSSTYYHKGIIGWYGDGFPASTNWGDYVVSFIVMFFQRH